MRRRSRQGRLHNASGPLRIEKHFCDISESTRGGPKPWLDGESCTVFIRKVRKVLEALDNKIAFWSHRRRDR